MDQSTQEERERRRQSQANSAHMNAAIRRQVRRGSFVARAVEQDPRSMAVTDQIRKARDELKAGKEWTVDTRTGAYTVKGEEPQ